METVQAMTSIPKNPCPTSQLSEEILRFLAKWRLEASVNGFLCVQPVGPNLECAELSDMVGRLTHVYRKDPPAVIAFDFCDVVLPIWKWRPMHTMLHEFAQSIGGYLRVVSAGSRGAAIAVINASGRLKPRFTC